MHPGVMTEQASGVPPLLTVVDLSAANYALQSATRIRGSEADTGSLRYAQGYVGASCFVLHAGTWANHLINLSSV